LARHGSNLILVARREEQLRAIQQEIQDSKAVQVR
jgi:short-subunit dehydrogenase